MATLFLSYRRQDPGEYSGRVAQDLRAACGNDAVFVDIHMGTGTDFVGEIEHQIGSCNAVIALIGPRWLDATDAQGQRRLEQADDFLRLELVAALRRGVPIVPVLVGGAALPASAQLPEELRPLLRYQALALSDERWTYDMQQLLSSLARLGISRRRPLLESPGRFARVVWSVLTLLVVAAIGLSWAASSTQRVPLRPRVAEGKANPTIRVQGKIMDLWRRPVHEISVTVNGKEAVVESTGGFRMDGVQVPYDLTMIVRTVPPARSGTYVWVYRGLTRPDPTLQVYRAHSEYGTSLSANLSSPSARSDDRVPLVVGLGAGGALFSYHEPGAVRAVRRGVGWSGERAIETTAHLIHWVPTRTMPSESGCGSFAYAEQALRLTASAPADLTLRAESKPFACSVLRGRVNTPRSWDGYDMAVYARFADGAALPLITSKQAALQEFAQLVPRMDGMTLELGASVGDSYRGGAVAHRVVEASSLESIAFSVPDPPSLLAPAERATSVNASTVFRWKSRGVSMLVIGSPELWRTVYIVTAASEAVVPESVFHEVLPAGSPHYWHVQQHGPFASVDEALGSEGFLDSWADFKPKGPLRASGSFAQSPGRTFITAP